MIASPNAAPHRSLPWRLGSMAVMGAVGVLSRAFLFGLNKVEVTGLNHLLGVLDRRRTQGRVRGLLTVCNHVAVLDDPLIWGILPFRYMLSPENLRWGLGAHDICFKSKYVFLPVCEFPLLHSFAISVIKSYDIGRAIDIAAASTFRLSSLFFSLGQVLPTRRLWHSPFGGLYQPTMTQALGLLASPKQALAPNNTSFSTDGKDSFNAPAAYTANRGSWVHVFPEACCHQSPESTLRYFKWGVSRLILESDIAPEFIPMFIHGTQNIMPEDRGFPRFLPRVGNRIRVVIGEPTDVDVVFGQERAAWKHLASRGDPKLLIHAHEATQLRIQVARSVREEVAKLRESVGLPPEDDRTAALADTWSKEPANRKFRSPVDGSLVNRT